MTRGSQPGIAARLRLSCADLIFGLDVVLRYVTGDRLVVLRAHLYPAADGRFEEDRLRENLRFIACHCSVLRLEDALETLSRRRSLPRRGVALVVDDATKGFHDRGWPLLEELGLPFVLAVNPGLIRSQEKEHLLSRLMRVAGHQYALPPEEMLQRALRLLGAWGERPAGYADLFARAWDLEPVSLTELLRLVDAVDDEFMSWDDLAAVQRSGLVTFASHTMSHPHLRNADGEWLVWELSRSKSLLEERLGGAINCLVVPYGGLDEMTPGVRQAVAQAGYRYSLLTEPGAVACGTGRYTIPRMSAEVSSASLRLACSPPLCALVHPARRLLGANSLCAGS